MMFPISDAHGETKNRQIATLSLTQEQSLMSIAEINPTKLDRQAWDWKQDTRFVEQLRQDLRRQAMTRIRSGIRAISVSSLVPYQARVRSTIRGDLV